MNLYRHALGAALALSLTCGASEAAQVNFSFLATVTATDGSLSGVAVGSHFLGWFGYDAATVGTDVDDQLAIYSLGQTSHLAANIGGHHVMTRELGATIYNDFGGNVEDMVTIGSTHRLVWDRQVHDGASFGFTLASAAGHTGVLTSTQLPTRYDLGAFDAGPSLNYGWLQRDGYPGGSVLSFTFTRISSAVPEVSSAATALLGLGLMSVALRRRSKPDPTR